VATKTSGLDFGEIAPKSSSTMTAVLEVLEPVPDGVIAVLGEATGNGQPREVLTPGKFRTVQALATRVFRDSEGALSVREIDGVAHVVRLK
jgi:hypothetical protein